MAEPSVTLLHKGARYAVRLLRCSNEPSAVVCFEYWTPQPGLDGEFAAEGFFRHRGINAVGVLAAENDWFQHAEIETVLAAIRAALPGYTLTGYGGSMGAYACINFADRLGLRRVVAVCPQYSIDQARAPYEGRWPAEAARIAADGGFVRDRIDQVSPPVEGWIVYDPSSVDAQHAAAIQARHRLTDVHVRFALHQEMRLLQQADLFTPMLLDMLGGQFDVAAFRQRLRVGRRRSAMFWVGLSAALLAHRRPQAARRAIAMARPLPHPEPAEIDIQAARAEAACGDLAAASALAVPWTADPAWGEAAAPLAALWPAMSPAPPAAEPARRRPRWLLGWRTRA